MGLEENVLIKKLDEFIRKYYQNKLLKGLIYTVAIVLGFFLAIVVLEYFGNFSNVIRGGLFFSFLSTAIFVLVYYVFIPFFKLNKLGKIISYDEAAQIVGSHFGNVQDKLLNTLQLMKMQKAQSNSPLLLASIDQRITELHPVPFTTAIDLSENKKYLKYAFIPLLFFLGIYVFNSKVITQGTTRIVNYNTQFEPMAPFQFHVLNDNLEVIEGEDFTLNLRMIGDVIPDEVVVNFDNQSIKLEKDSKTEFSYVFSNIQKNKEFYFTASNFDSKTYEIKTIPNPLVMGFEVELNYPSYTGIANQKLTNVGDFTVPEGTAIKWIFKTKNTENLMILFQDSNFVTEKTLFNQFDFQKRLFSSEKYTIVTKNQYLTSRDSISYYLSVIRDEIPNISANEEKDSLNSNVKIFKGEISDDYGFSSLSFVYTVITKDSSGNENSKLTKQPLSFNSKFNKDRFYHYFDINQLGLGLGDKVEYYFEVSDNDGINGAKYARTIKNIYKAPTLEELKAKNEQSNSDLKKDMQESLKDAKNLQEEIKKLREEMINKKDLNWQDKKKLENLLDKQKELKEDINQIQEKNQQKNELNEEFNQLDEKTKEQQEHLENLMDQLNSEEMQEMYEKLEKMMEKMDKDQLQQAMEEMDWKNEDIQKELERTLEMFKQMEMDEKLNEIANELEELSKKQEELSENKEMTNEEKEKKQEELNKEFDDVQKEMDKMDKMNEELENKRETDELKNDEEQIKQYMMESLEQLQKNNEKKASGSQKNASEKMKEMAKKMQSMMSGQSGDKLEEDMDNLRALLENLIQLSFDQEEVMEGLKITQSNDPKYVKLGQEQRNLKDDAEMIADSLFALSKRIIQIQPIVNKEIGKVNSHMDKSISFIKERQTNQASSNQQFAMTSINNLALLLDEALQQMQQQASSKKPGNSNCNKPGGSNPKPMMIPSLQQMQQSVGQQLQKMRDKMDKEGGAKKGEKGSPSSGEGTSKELAKMAAEQAAIRKEMQKLNNSINGDGKMGKEFRKIEKDMNKIEEDIVNKNISDETIQRQQEVMEQLEQIRLLESEKAQRERELDKKRESENVKNPKISNPDEFLEYKKKKEQEIEMLRTIPAELVPYYKNRVNEYFEKLNY